VKKRNVVRKSKLPLLLVSESKRQSIEKLSLEKRLLKYDSRINGIVMNNSFYKPISKIIYFKKDGR